MPAESLNGSGANGIGARPESKNDRVYLKSANNPRYLSQILRVNEPIVALTVRRRDRRRQSGEVIANIITIRISGEQRRPIDVIWRCFCVWS